MLILLIEGFDKNPSSHRVLKKTRAPATCASVCSTAGNGCLFLRTLSLSLVIWIHTDSDSVVGLGSNYHPSTPICVGIDTRDDTQYFHVLQFLLDARHQGNWHPARCIQGERDSSLFQSDSVFSLYLPEALE